MAPFQAHGDGTGGEIEVSEPKPAQGVLAESEPGQAHDAHLFPEGLGGNQFLHILVGEGAALDALLLRPPDVRGRVRP
jgi:hypothetical protein